MPLEHLKYIKTTKAINGISFLCVVSQIFHEVYNVIYNGTETDKKLEEAECQRGQPARSVVVLQHSGDRTGVMCMVVSSGPFSSRIS